MSRGDQGASPFVRETPAKALRLSVRNTGAAKQFCIRNDTHRLADFETEYVEFSGYFGKHGPAIFAAAPDLLEAVQAFMERWDQGSRADTDYVASLMKAALRRAGACI